MCDCCNNVVESYDCIINPDQISGVCVGPGDGTGFYPTLIDCELVAIGYNCL